MNFGPILGSLLGAFGGRALGGMIGGNTGRMIGSLAGSMLGSRGGSSMGGGGLGGMLGGLLGGKTQQPDTRNQTEFVATEVDEDHAALLISAMCSAAKSDGKVDQAELDAIMSRLGSVGADEEAFVRQELSGSVDLASLVARVPKGLETEVYAVSVLAIDMQSGLEAQYLSDLASSMGLSAGDVAQMRSSIKASLES
jgi:uncharacterized membrane protein YebE (DUF533 family)